MLLLAVGARQPDWVSEGFREYAKRMPREASLQLREIKPEPRRSGKGVADILAAEARRIKAALPPHSRLIVLDEQGDDPDTEALAQRLEQWRSQRDGCNELVFIIGGPDGLDATLKAGAHDRLRLSSLTLPHGLARVLLAEALYRAHSLASGHPYHRGALQ